jgi:enoyl-CoA hydratase
MLDDGTFSFLTLSRPGPGVVLAEMKNPQNRNRTRQRDRDEFGRLMSEAKSDAEARVIVIAGHGGVFSEGDDHSNDPYDPDDYYSRSSTFIHHFVNTDMPVIVALNGDVRGLGLTIALLADLLIVERQVTLCDVHVLGGVASATGPFLWPLSAGFMRAKRYLLTGDAFSAEEAVAMGLASEVVDEGKGVTRALDYANRLAGLRPESLQATKHNMNQWLRMVSDLVLNHGLAKEFLTFPPEYAATTK